jgi:DNA-binding response OmpR family regulator
MSAGRVTKAELQGSRFLAKPFELDDLLDTVSAELNRPH